jgi:hypothetical protein
VTAYPNFPDLSRKPALKTKDSLVDPTLRDNMENGMETTRAKFTRPRRQWTVTIEFLSATDKIRLQDFVEDIAVYGANIFRFPDFRDATNPVWYSVRFSKLPNYEDEGWVEDTFRSSTTFEIREV